MIEKGLSVFFLVLSIFYLYFASHLSFGSVMAPKAGFLPNLVGVLATILSSINLVFTMKKAPSRDESIDKYTAVNIALLLAGSLAFILALEKLGFVASTTLYLIGLMKLTRTKGYVKPIVISLGVAFAFYFSFSTLLDVVLP